MIEFQSQNNVVSGTEITILSFTNTLTDKNIDKIVIEGNARAEWNIYFNLNKEIRKRSSVSSLSHVINLYRKKININDIIDVKVIHYGPSLAQFSSAVIFK